MKIGDLVKLNLSEETNKFSEKNAFTKESYWAFPAWRVADFDGKPIFDVKHLPTVIPSNSIGFILNIGVAYSNLPIIVVIENKFYAFDVSELVVIRAA